MQTLVFSTKHIFFILGTTQTGQQLDTKKLDAMLREMQAAAENAKGATSGSGIFISSGSSSAVVAGKTFF